MIHYLTKKNAMFKAVLEAEGVVHLLGQGVSMEPLFGNKDRVTTVACKVLECGKCYVYTKGVSLLLHRLVKKKGNDCLFLGDNADFLEWVPSKNVVAYVNNPCSDTTDRNIAFVNKLCSFLSLNRRKVPYLINYFRRWILHRWIHKDIHYQGNREAGR